MRCSTLAVWLAAMLSCVALAACGGGARSAVSGATGSSNASSQLAFANCMRAHGVPNFPDLSSNGMRIGEHGQTVSVNGVSLNAPAFTAALKQCEQYRQQTSGSQAQAAQQTRKGLQFAKCMRGRGVPNFPDPKVISSSGSNQVVYLPGINPEAPAVKAGAKACGGGPKGP